MDAKRLLETCVSKVSKVAEMILIDVQLHVYMCIQRP